MQAIEVQQGSHVSDKSSAVPVFGATQNTSGETFGAVLGAALPVATSKLSEATNYLPSNTFISQRSGKSGEARSTLLGVGTFDTKVFRTVADTTRTATLPTTTNAPIASKPAAVEIDSNSSLASGPYITLVKTTSSDPDLIGEQPVLTNPSTSVTKSTLVKTTAARSTTWKPVSTSSATAVTSSSLANSNVRTSSEALTAAAKSNSLDSSNANAVNSIAMSLPAVSNTVSAHTEEPPPANSAKLVSTNTESKPSAHAASDGAIQRTDAASTAQSTHTKSISSSSLDSEGQATSIQPHPSQNLPLKDALTGAAANPLAVPSAPLSSIVQIASLSHEAPSSNEPSTAPAQTNTATVKDAIPASNFEQPASVVSSAVSATGTSELDAAPNPTPESTTPIPASSQLPASKPAIQTIAATSALPLQINPAAIESSNPSATSALKSGSVTEQAASSFVNRHLPQASPTSTAAETSFQLLNSRSQPLPVDASATTTELASATAVTRTPTSALKASTLKSVAGSDETAAHVGAAKPAVTKTTAGPTLETLPTPTTQSVPTQVTPSASHTTPTVTTSSAIVSAAAHANATEAIASGVAAPALQSASPASLHVTPALAVNTLDPVASLQRSPSTDAAEPLEPHTTLVATPTTLEVGVPGGTQGWLKIRAEVSTQGDVTASLSAATSAGQESLHRQLPALNAYLHSEQMAVSTSVTDRVFAASSAGPAATSVSIGSSAFDGSGRPFTQTASTQDGATQHGGTSGGSSQRDDRESSVSPASSTTAATPSIRSYEIGIDSGSATIAPSALDSVSGRWLNVRA